MSIEEFEQRLAEERARQNSGTIEERLAALEAGRPFRPRPRSESIFAFRRIIAFGIAVSSLLIFLLLGSWCWFLRDGLGPDSIESSGSEAWRRFSTDFWPVALFCFVLFGVAFWVAPRRPSQRDTSSFSTANGRE